MSLKSFCNTTILVRWAERQGKPNECEMYHASELRRLDEERARHLHEVFKGFSDLKLSDPSPELESVTSFEQMDHQTPIDLYKGSSDPKPGDPSLPEAENIPPVTLEGRWVVAQRVQAWLWGKNSGVAE